MVIDGKTRLLGILGQNIDYTLSPEIHNFSIQKSKKNLVYVPFDVVGADIPQLLDGLWNVGALGFNVTTPHKSVVASLISSQLPSVNTVYRGKKGWLGASTDGKGFEKGLEKIGGDLNKIDRVVFFGNGGVVRGLLEYFVARRHWEEKNSFFVLGRRGGETQKCERLAPGRVVSCPFSLSGFRRALNGATSRTLVIQGTSAPLHGLGLGEFVAGLEGFEGFFVDLVYTTPSELLGHCQQLGIRHQDGLPMLIEQARLSQELWWGESCDYQQLAELLQKRINGQ